MQALATVLSTWRAEVANERSKMVRFNASLEDLKLEAKEACITDLEEALESIDLKVSYGEDGACWVRDAAADAEEDA